MTFCLINVPAILQRLMECCMGDLKLTEYPIFLDDILIFSEEHFQRIEAVFSRLHQHGPKLKPSQYDIFKVASVFGPCYQRERCGN